MGATGKSIEAALRSCGAYGGQKWSMTELANGANDAAKTLGITTREGLAVLIAQCMIESAWFRATVEYTSSYTARYDPYRGRTFIMNTFQAGYRLVGQYAKSKGLLSDSEYFVKNPVRLGDYKWAWVGPAAYFNANGLTALANAGRNNDVGRIIHAGAGRSASSYPSSTLERTRQSNADKAYRAVLASGITAPGPAAFRYEPDFDGCWTIRRIQRNVGVPDDGIYAIQTKKAVAAAQKKLGVKADGLFGEVTQRAMVKAQRAGTYPRPEKPEKTEPKKKAPNFPLPSGHWYGVQSSNPRNHSGYYRKDRAGIKKWQRRMKKRGWRIKVDGRFGPRSQQVARGIQRQAGITVDGAVGIRTWRKSWTEPVT